MNNIFLLQQIGSENQHLIDVIPHQGDLLEFVDLLNNPFIRLKDIWKPPHLRTFRRGKKFLDFAYTNATSSIFFSERAYLALSPYLSDFGEFLPIMSDFGQGYFFHPTSCVKASEILDLETSRIGRFGMEKYALKNFQDRLPPIFKLDFEGLATWDSFVKTYVCLSFKKTVESLELTGFGFKDLK